MSVELYEIYCHEIDGKTLIGVDLGKAFCKNQIPCHESKRPCVFCFAGQPLPLEKGATKRHIKEAIRMVKKNNGIVGLVSYRVNLPSNQPSVSEIDVPEEIESLMKKFQSGEEPIK